jgi:hypothetical protein
LLVHSSPLRAVPPRPPPRTATRRCFTLAGRRPSGRWCCSRLPSSSVRSPPGRMPSLKMTDLFSGGPPPREFGVDADDMPPPSAAAVEPFRLSTPTGTRTLGGWDGVEAPATCSATGILSERTRMVLVSQRVKIPHHLVGQRITVRPVVQRC